MLLPCAGPGWAGLSGHLSMQPGDPLSVSAGREPVPACKKKAGQGCKCVTNCCCRGGCRGIPAPGLPSPVLLPQGRALLLALPQPHQAPTAQLVCLNVSDHLPAESRTWMDNQQLPEALGKTTRLGENIRSCIFFFFFHKLKIKNSFSGKCRRKQPPDPAFAVTF